MEVWAAIYHRDIRFSGGQTAGRAYFQAQETILEADCDLSVYRLLLTRVWHVAIVGQATPEDLERRLRVILVTGEPVTLPSDVPKMLQERRAQATRFGPWVQRHHRGKPL